MNDSTATGLLRKPIGDVQRDAAVQDLSRSLGAWHPVLFGVGCIIGSGVFVLTGIVGSLVAWIGGVPVLAIVFCILMVLPLIIDIVGKAMHGNAIPAFLLGGYCAAGALVYLGCGRRHSKLRRART